MSLPRTAEPSSQLLTIVSRHFASLGSSEVAFVCRVVSRGHAAHGATLATAGPPAVARRRAAYEKSRLRAAELALAWADLSALFATIDMEEETEVGSPSYALARRLQVEIVRVLFEPDCVSKASAIVDLIPPRQHLPSRIPEALRPLYPSPPVRSRTRPPAGSGAPLPLQ